MAIVVSILAAIVVAVLLEWWWRTPQRRLKHIKQIPSESIMYGNILEIIERGEVECHRDWALKHGPVFFYCIGRAPVLFVSDAHLLKEIMTKITHFDQRPTLGSVQTPVLKSLFNAEGMQWKTLRHALNPSFAHHQLAQFAPLFDRCINSVIGRLEGVADTDQSIDLTTLFKQMALDIIGSAAFAQKFETVVGISTSVTDAAGTLLDIGRQNLKPMVMLIPSLFWMPSRIFLHLPFVKSLMAKASLMDEWVFSIVEDRSAPSAPVPPKDLLALMMETTDKATQKPLFDREQLAGNARTFLIAGHETTGTTIAIALYHIDRNPDVKRRVFEEIDRLTAEGDNNGDQVQSKQYMYLDWVIKESMRTLTVTPIVNRGASADVTIGDGSLFIPAGTGIAIPTHVLHHSREYWGDPELFRPERFDPSTDEYRQRNSNCYMPFGAGPRMCIGFRFALEEIKQTIINVLRQFDLKVAYEKTEEPLRSKFRVTLDITGGIHFRVHRRTPRTTV